MRKILLNIIELISKGYWYNGIMYWVIRSGFVSGSFRLNKLTIEKFPYFPFVQRMRKLPPPLKPIQPDHVLIHSGPLCLI
jgi:hypothetical protein